ncbi:MAG: histidine kinase dimerization/phospho-acceptor domain-containing protein [Anaerolineaceae bacterium]
MTSILLLSADKSIEKVVLSAIPADVTLKSVKHSITMNFVEQFTRQTDFGLILVDIDQPVDDRAQLKALKIGQIPVIALISNLNQREALYHAGIVDFLAKPLILEEVKIRLACYLQKIEIHQPDIKKEERDQLTHQIIQNERLITIGRLITSICHEITNRMQAAQGALSLALEEHELSNDMQSYLSIGQQETHRVSQLIERLRQIYRPKTDPFSETHLETLLSETRALALDNTINQHLKIDLDVSPDLPVIRGMAGQLQFACLSLLLNLRDVVDVNSPGIIRIRTSTIGPTVQIEYSTNAPLSPALAECMKTESGPSPGSLESALGISTVQQVLNPHKGEVGCLYDDPGVTIWMSIPFT